MQTYKLREAIVGFDDAVPRVVVRLISIPAGSVITLPERPLRMGIVEVEYEGRMIGVFLRDLKDRGDLEERVAIEASVL